MQIPNESSAAPNPKPSGPTDSAVALDRLPVFRLDVRVGYHEVDGQRRVHHANYLNYFERGRVEMLRAAGFDYRRFEQEGLMLVISEINLRYRGAAEFDDLLRISTWVVEARGARIRHHHRVEREGELLVESDLVCACIDSGGRARRLPREWVEHFSTRR
ncbi:MAG: acyl-CoA thioesterase [Planctomycetaceae bacterium]|nr:MAG: acyl-CoA thioesterase [Planctomycetaceae bacterium]